MILLLRILCVQITKELKCSLKMKRGNLLAHLTETPGYWTSLRHGLIQESSSLSPPLMALFPPESSILLLFFFFFSF